MGRQPTAQYVVARTGVILVTIINIRADHMLPQLPRSSVRSFAKLETARAFEATRPTFRTTTRSKPKSRSLTPNTATLLMSLTIHSHYPRTSRPRAFRPDLLSTRAVLPCQVRELSGYVLISSIFLQHLTCSVSG